MANFHVIAGASDTPAFPTVRRIGPTDLKDALRTGFADFWAMPSQVFFIGLIYPIAGAILAGFAFGQNMLPLLYPLASGFALVGPLVSIGLYELSRRREQGLPTDWKYAFEVLQSPAIGSIAALGVILLVIFMAWLFTAQALYEWLYGYRPVESLLAFLYEALTTSRGWMLIILGNLIGFVFAAVVLAISVISFPLLLDRDVGVAVAVQTSVRAVLTARYAALVPFGKVAPLLSELLPMGGAQNAGTVRNRTLRVGQKVVQQHSIGTAKRPSAQTAGPVMVGLDGGYVRSRHRREERHFEVVAGKVIDAHGAQHRFAFARNGQATASEAFRQALAVAGVRADTPATVMPGSGGY